MRQAGLRLGRIFGIDVSADVGVLFFAALLTWSLATQILPFSDPGLSGAAYWSVAAIGALLLLVSLLAHELSHAVVAMHNDIEVEGITLWLFGGVARFKSDATTPGAEFRIAAAGPAMSALLAGASFGASYALTRAGAPDVYATALAWLGLLNGILAVFNMLPGAPLDGGRVLASAIWKVRGDRLQSKIWAARVGRVVALLLIAAGFAEVIMLGSFGGLWTVFIGWFLMGAARMEEAHYVGERALGSLAVSEAMVREPQSVKSWTTVQDTVNGPLRWTSQSAIPVLDWNGNVAGVVTMNQIKRVPADRWPTTSVTDVMLPAAFIPTARPDEQLKLVMERLKPEFEGLALVLDGGRLVGLVTPVEVGRAVTLGRLAGHGTPVQTSVTPLVTSGGPPPPPPFVPTQQWEPPVVQR